MADFTAPRVEKRSITQKGEFQTTMRASVTPHRMRVDIVICVDGTLDGVKKSLQALTQFTTMPYSFILVDDCTDDVTRKYLVDFALAEGAMLLRSDEPMRFARAADKGLHHSNADYLLLLRSGVQVEPEWLDRMVACAESDDLIGLVEPLSNYDPCQAPFQAKQTDWSQSAPPEGASPTDTARKISETSTQIYPRLPFLNGFCLMIKRKVINQVGYLESAGTGEWPAEAADYGRRAGKAGWQLALADDVHVSYQPS